MGRLLAVSDVAAKAGHPDRPFDLEDLVDAPDDGYRYEVIDGALVVNPAPTWRHQDKAGGLLVALRGACPSHLIVLTAPAWRIVAGQVPEPDLVVVDRPKLGEIAVEGTPELVVEVLSPSNRGSDLVRKRDLYAQAGCPRYWIVDPEGPSLIVFSLDRKEGAYKTEVEVTAPAVVEVDRPFPVSVRLADL